MEASNRHTFHKIEGVESWAGLSMKNDKKTVTPLWVTVFL